MRSDSGYPPNFPPSPTPLRDSPSQLRWGRTHAGGWCFSAVRSRLSWGLCWERIHSHTPLPARSASLPCRASSVLSLLQEWVTTPHHTSPFDNPSLQIKRQQNRFLSFSFQYSNRNLMERDCSPEQTCRTFPKPFGEQPQLLGEN